MFSKILVTTDLSEEAKRAYQMAHELSIKHGSTVTLLHVIDTSFLVAYPGIIDMPVIVAPGAVDDVRNRVVEQLKKDAQESFPNMQVNIEIRDTVGSPHLLIADYAKESQADLLVMATHGRSGIKRALLGSVAELVSRHCHLPVLLIPCKAG